MPLLLPVALPLLHAAKGFDPDAKTDSLRLSYNKLSSVAGLKQVMSELLTEPDLISWIDLSHNQLTTIEQVCSYCWS